MASASSGSVPLPYGKKYYCNFIYNYAARRNLVTNDTKLSLKFVEFLVGKLKDWGYTQCYYYDENARPGADVFDQLFDAAKSSVLTLVILTEYFSQNLWVRYSGKAVFKTLIGENKDSRDKLIPIVLGNAPVPDELDVNDVLSFDVDENTWHDEKHEQQLKKLRRVLDEGVPRADSKFPIQDYGDGIQRSEGGHIIVNPLPSMPGASNITQDRNERQMESLSSSVAAIHISNTLALTPGSLATSSKALQDCETSPSFRTEKLHRNVLNRCLSALLRDLDFNAVLIYIQEKELFDDVTIRDIVEQKTTSDKIRELIKQIQQRDKDTYEKFKECLVQAKQAFFKDMLEKEEAKEYKQCTVTSQYVDSEIPVVGWEEELATVAVNMWIQDHRDNTAQMTEGHLLPQPLSSSVEEDLSRSDLQDIVNTDLESRCPSRDRLREKHTSASDGSDRNLDDVDGPSSQCNEINGSRQNNPDKTAVKTNRTTQQISWSTYL